MNKLFKKLMKTNQEIFKKKKKNGQHLKKIKM